MSINKKTRLDKINNGVSNSAIIGRLKSTEQTGRGSPEHIGDAAQIPFPASVSVDERRTTRGRKSSGKNGSVRSFLFVPVLDKNGKPIMPCSPARARWLMRSGRAIPQHHKNHFYIKLLDVEVNNCKLQDICVGVDPGSKREGFTVKSRANTYVNITSNAVIHVKVSIEERRNMRKARRFRNTPCRKNKSERSCIRKNRIPPSTRSRWNAKLRIINMLRKLYPINSFVVEDISATTKKGKKKWNVSFSPLEVGKEYFYTELRKIGELVIKQGFETKALRTELGLKKSSGKLEDKFSAHCVDSWVLANSFVGGHRKPDNEELIRMIPIQYSRRQLHAFQPSAKGFRRRYGGRCGKFSKSSIVKHTKYGICYIGGYIDGLGISLHNLFGKRLCQNAKEKDFKVLCYNSWRHYYVLCK